MRNVTIQLAINIKPKLPLHLKPIMTSREYFKVMEADTEIIKMHVKNKMRNV